MFKRKDSKLIISINYKDKGIFTALILLIGFVAVTLATRKFFYDPDSFWHIKTGIWIWDNKQIPRFDTFSWYGIEHNLTWLNHEWLFDLLAGFMYRLGGLNLIMWFVSFVGGVLFLLLTYFSYIKNKNIFLSIIISSVALFGLQPYLQPRPQILSFCLLSIVCILLEKKKWFWILPVMVLEANLHGGFWPLFIVVITYYSYKEKPLLILLSVLAVLINPYGFEMFLYTYRNQSSDLGAKFIIESFKTQMWDAENKIVLLSYIVLIAATHNVKIKWQDALFVFAVGGLTFMAQRHVVFAYLLIMPIMSPYLLTKIDSLIDTFEKITKIKILKNFVFSLIVEVALIILLISGIGNLTTIKGENLVPISMYPSEKAISFIKENKLTRIFNDYGIGGYLLLNNIPTLLDGRGDPFSEKFNDTTILSDYCEVITLSSDYVKFLQTNKIKYLLLPNKGKLSISISSNPRFAAIYKDEHFTIYDFKE
jgi:hypothetical protein